ncbi:MAG: hypothetical protein O2931_17285 [Planctomycetota bacterium]|nr:hypothetical protein [Planctomycetota bacterium]MDA1180536.1 hypothetical protein [Planctomycetota bacterium]
MKQQTKTQRAPYNSKHATWIVAWLCLASVAVLPSTALAQRVILSETFNDDVSGQPPNSGQYSFSRTVNPDTDPAQAVITGGAFADPFGTGNKSLLLHNPRGTTQMAVVWFNEFDDNPAAFRNGSIEFDLYLEDPQGYWTYLDARIGHGDAARGTITTVGGSDTTAWNSYRLQTRPDGNPPTEDIVDDGIPAQYHDLDSPDDLFGPNRAVHVRYDFDGTGSTFQDPPTYTISIDNKLVLFETESGPSATRFWSFNSSTFQFAPGVNIFGFWTDASAQNTGPGAGTNLHTGNVYIDNLKVTNNDLAPTADLNNDGLVDGADVGIVFNTWGNSPQSVADLNSDGVVDGADLATVYDG